MTWQHHPTKKIAGHIGSHAWLYFAWIYFLYSVFDLLNIIYVKDSPQRCV